MDKLVDMSQPLLMIEDDARLAAMVSEYLAQSGYTVEVAGSGEEGLARLQAAGIDRDAAMPAKAGGACASH